MNIYRLIFFALLAINCVLIVLTISSSGSRATNRPQAHIGSLNADKIVLPSDQAKAAPTATPTALNTSAAAKTPPVTVQACVALLGLSPRQINTIEAQALSLNLQSREVALVGPSGWWVLIPALGSRAAAERKVIELDQLGVVDRFILAEPGPRLHAISLGWFRSEESALKHLRKVVGQGVIGAKVVPKEDPTQDVRMEIRGEKTNLEQFATNALPAYSNAQRTPCPVNNG